MGDPSKPTKITIWNARGVRNKLEELYQFLEDDDVDICGVSETKLSININLRSNSKYLFIRNDRDSPNPGGGVGIAIKRGIKFEILPSYNTKVIEHLTIKVFTPTSFFLFTVIYFPGASRRGSTLQSFKQDLINITRSSIPFIVAGDWNGRHSLWNCVRANPTGNAIYKHVTSHPLMIHYPFDHTYTPDDPDRNPSTLDFAISNCCLDISDLTVQEPISDSDHAPVSFTVNSQTPLHHPPYHMKDYTNANWTHFKAILNEQIDLRGVSADSFTNFDQIDDAIEDLTRKILHAEELAVPVKHVTMQNDQLNSHTKSLIAIKRAVRRRFQRNRTLPLRDELKELDLEVKRLIREQINEKFQKNLEKISENDPLHSKLWRLTKNLRNRSNASYLMKDGRKFISPAEKANLLKDEMLIAHSLTHKERNTSDHERQVTQTIRELTNEPVDLSQFRFISVAEIRHVLKCSKARKAAGFDRINNRCLKFLPNKAVALLSYIFNACVRLSHFPCKWKHAIILAFRKPGKDPKDPRNYRPISLLSSLSKIFERCILDRLNGFAEEHQLIKNEQFGFRKGHSCVHQVARICSKIKQARNRKRTTVLISLDIQRAFDTVWQRGLVHKLVSLGIPSYLSKLLLSFLTGRTFQIKVGSTLSDVAIMVAGTPQGSCLSPALYSLYTSDLPTARDCDVGQFADDTLLFASALRGKVAQKRVQTALNRFHRYYKKWRIKINPEKFEAIFFTRRRKTCYHPRGQLTASGVDIPWSPFIKYLGVIIPKNLTFKSHFEYSISKIEKSTKILYPLIGRKSKLNVESKVLLYKTIFRPVLSYAAPVWRKSAKTNLKRLQVSQNKLLKLCLKARMRKPTSEVHEETGVEMMIEHLDKISTNFRSKCAFSDNPEITNIDFSL